MHCPTCGSSVSSDATVCPNCGEELQSYGGETTSVTSAPATLSSTGSSLNEPESTDKKICPECGAINRADDNFCSTCGASLNIKQSKAARGTTEQTGTANTSPRRQYLIAGATVLVIAALVYVIAAPKEHPGPPVDQQQQPAGDAQQGALPPGHPPMNGQTMTAEQEKLMAELKAALAKTPNDTTTQLKLANVLYDAGHHSEAIPLYQKYLKANPDNGDARTDMAFSLFQTGDMDGSMAELKHVLAVNSRHQTAAHILARLYFEKLSQAITSKTNDSIAASGKPTSKQDVRDSLQMLGYRDSLFLWLNRVVEIDSTTQQGREAAQILAELMTAHSGNGMAPGGK